MAYVSVVSQAQMMRSARVDPGRGEQMFYTRNARTSEYTVGDAVRPPDQRGDSSIAGTNLRQARASSLRPDVDGTGHHDTISHDQWASSPNGASLSGHRPAVVVGTLALS